jgi:hypothetical protein
MIELGRRLISGKRFVTMRVEDANDLTVNFNCVRDPDATVESVVDTLGDGGLSGARQTG